MLHIALKWLFAFLIGTAPAQATAEPSKYIMYLTGQHPIVPSSSLVEDVTHVALAFMRSETFHDPHRRDWPLFMKVEDARKKFPSTTKIMVAIGGWGNSAGFEDAARTKDSRAVWVNGVRRMVEATGADGVDIDWEYPGGNGEDYKSIPNSAREWEIDAYAQLLAALRKALGTSIISTAVPGLPRDMLAFTPSTVPSIMSSVDFLNVMTYDLMNRRDNVTKHHTGIKLSLEAIDAYISAGLAPSKANLGLAFYIKWYKTEPAAREECTANPIGCKTDLMEDPDSGADLGKAGAFSWHDPVPKDLEPSFSKAMKYGEYDNDGGGHYFFDADKDIFWSWDTPQAIKRKIPQMVNTRGLGGVFAWGLGEDAPAFEHLKAASEGIAELRAERTDRSEL